MDVADYPNLINFLKVRLKKEILIKIEDYIFWMVEHQLALVDHRLSAPTSGDDTDLTILLSVIHICVHMYLS